MTMTLSPCGVALNDEEDDDEADDDEEEDEDEDSLRYFR